MTRGFHIFIFSYFHAWKLDLRRGLTEAVLLRNGHQLIHVRRVSVDHHWNDCLRTCNQRWIYQSPACIYKDSQHICTYEASQRQPPQQGPVRLYLNRHF